MALDKVNGSRPVAQAPGVGVAAKKEIAAKRIDAFARVAGGKSHLFAGTSVGGILGRSLGSFGVSENPRVVAMLNQIEQNDLTTLQVNRPGIVTGIENLARGLS